MIFLFPLSHSVLYSPLPVYVGSLCHVVSLGAHHHAPSWLRLPPGSKAAPAALHRTAGERGPSPGMTGHTKIHAQTWHGVLVLAYLAFQNIDFALIWLDPVVILFAVVCYTLQPDNAGL